ncbi:unnamed protein product [Coregonus sp. 'balchen']|nr:unnamed protein product [Coregonus sp. 'balchen']
MDTLTEALNAISVSTELVEQELKPHLDTLLAVLLDKKKGAAVEIASSGILPILAQSLREKSPLTNQVALVVAEMAREAAVRDPCIDAGLVTVLVPLLNSADEELLLHTGRAIGRICFDNTAQQDQLVQCGVIPRLVAIMRENLENDPLVNVCLLALCNLADMDTTREALVEVGVAEVLTAQLKRATDAERRHIILEVLGSLGENDVLKLQFVESGVPEALSEMIRGLQGGSDPHDLCSIKIASNLIVSLLLGDESMQKCFGEGTGVVYQDVLSWLQSSNTQLQLSGALAIANFARNASNKVRMLEDGVTERIRTLLRSDMPPVQFKLLGTLRMMVDGQVINAVTKADGVRHLISMATSEHLIMQNEALVAMAIASAIDIDSMQESFREAELLPTLQKMLDDPVGAVEFKAFPRNSEH